LQVDPNHELIDIDRIDLDPVTDGFSSVVLELLREGDFYVVQETAQTTGNRILRFCTHSEERALHLFESEKGTPERA
jgi:hypothetical protein